MRSNYVIFFVIFISMNFFFGYVIFSLKSLNLREKKLKKIQEDSVNMFNLGEKQFLLKLARKSLEFYFENNGRKFNVESFLKSELTEKEIKNVSMKTGVFVTLHKNGNLKGCVGLIFSNDKLYENVIDYAINAAVNDGRFDQVIEDELEFLDIEISVLTPAKKIESIEEIEIGKHGVILTKGSYRSVFLPQVAIEQEWDKEEMLERLSQKAGLVKEAYQEANLEVFEAEVFEEKKDEQIRKPDFVGSFYPKKKAELDIMLDGFIINDKKQKSRVIIVPHAGYIYSGKVAGYGYGALNRNLKTIVILAPSHNFNFKGIAYGNYDFFETPLGKISVDKKKIDLVENLDFVFKRDEVFYEHSLEVQIPFIQKRFNNKVKILPFVVGQEEPENVANLIDRLWEDKSIGFVISTDLSHYLSKKNCEKTDKATIQKIEDLEYKNLKPDELCGYNPVKGIIKFAKDNDLKISNVFQDDSSSASGDEKKVVGYGSFIIY